MRSGELIRVPATSLNEASKARSAAVSIAPWPAPPAGRAPARAARRALPPILSRSSTMVLRSAVMLGRSATLASTVPSMVWPLAVTLPL